MDYLKQVLGIDTIYTKGESAGFPNFIETRYDIRTALLDGVKVFIVKPMTELEQIGTLKKHVERIQRNESIPIVLALDKITFRQREYLIRNRIPFVVEGRQIYLPFMAAYIQERCNADEQESNEILPSAQMLLLYFIYNGSKDLYTSQAAKELNLTPTSLSRASRQLEEMQLLETRKQGVCKILSSNLSPCELFQKAEDKLRNPVKKTVYIPRHEKNEGLLESGYSALREYSMLSEPKTRCYAAGSVSKWKDVMTNTLMDSEAQVALEMWRYDPRKIAKGKTVDELSLALALKNDQDERVQKSVADMLNNLWREIDGRRN